ncbi:hypothetical protein ILUMI_23599 [Ignelater luminosus]|uniref:HPS5-like beta-propeller domain-containing protein n=1 Tax=Ignelater luminosus TaxID=2038154 RepID=A0A8K0FZI3_IGNLU|nr:hypothetical protein ILUMI_23599 [Ignelater luminosus]
MTNTLREWAPLTDLFNRLPAKVQNGLFTYDIKLTCVDVLPEFLALGTNFGLVYWYDRKKRDLQKLRCEHTNVSITVVKIISTVDYMVACGNKEGSISIFQIPKSHPESLPESLRPKNKQIERYTVAELHNAPITALEWAKNGMKLFSGDKNGHVVLTEIDFYMHLCKSIEILNESYEVVQLSYHQQSLLVSTTYRSIICKREDKWKVTQVGKKDRKVLGSFGGTFYQNGVRPNDLVLYCTRPGLRIWLSDVQGYVQQTLLFKDILNQRSPEAQLINPISKNLRKLLPQKEASFGILLPFNNNYLVTYNNDVVYILDPKELIVNTMVSHLRKVLSVAVHKDEIFILEGERSLVRLSERPEPIYDSTPTIPTASSFLPLTTSIKDLTQKLQSSSIISAIPPFIETAFGSNDFNVHTDATSIISAEEATESPRKNSPIRSSQLDDNKIKIYDKIANQDFDDAILFKHKRRKKPDMMTSVLSWSSNSSEEQEGSISKPTMMIMSTVGVLPDLRSPESIKNDIESKEKMLADVLCFNKTKVVLNDEKSVADEKDDNEHVDENEKNEKETSESPETPPENSNSVNLDDNDEYTVRPFATILPRFNGIKKNNIEMETCAYGPPSGSSNPNSISDVPACMNIPTEWQLQKVTMNNERKTTESSVSDLSGEWEII